MMNNIKRFFFGAVFFLITMTLAKQSFSENLIEQLQHIKLEENEYEIAEEIIWNINERGYLDTDLILIADRYNLLEDEIAPILYKVQRLEPKGIGSRNLKECLLVQLEDQNTSLPYKILLKSFCHIEVRYVLLMYM